MKEKGESATTHVLSHNQSYRVALAFTNEESQILRPMEVSHGRTFPTLPSWVVWLTIALVILTGAICMARVIAGIYTGKWWLMSLGVVFCVLYYVKVLRAVF